MDCGLLPRREARLWAHWWNVRGHLASLRPNGRGLFYCELQIGEKSCKTKKQSASSQSAKQ